MKKTKVSEVIRVLYQALFFAILIIQVYMAIAWAGNNGNDVQKFFESFIYINGSLGLPGDGWRLSGYSVFLSVVYHVFGDGAQLPVYLLQTVFFLSAVMYVISTFSESVLNVQLSNTQKYLVGLYITTIPIVWQMNFAILPDAFLNGLFLIMIGIIVHCYTENGKSLLYRLITLIGIILLFGVTEYNYFYGALIVSAVFTLSYLIFIAVKKMGMKKMLFMTGFGVLIISSAILLPILNNVNVNKQSYISYSIPAKLMDRFVYPGIRDDYRNYSEEMKSVIEEETANLSSERLEIMHRDLGPAVEAQLGKDRAEQIYWEMVRYGLNLRTRENIVRLGKDTLSNLLAPVSMEKCMYYNNNSRYGYNYQNMWENQPTFTMKYMHFGMNAVMFFTLVGVIATSISLIRKKVSKKSVMICCVWFFFCVLYTIPATLLSPGGADYRVGMLMTICWILLPVIMAVCNGIMHGKIAIKVALQIENER